MDIFGAKWRNHWQKISDNWRSKIASDDIVLLCGDLSWAMRPNEAEKDLAWIADLPGRKVFMRGNHDLWWQSIGRLRKQYPEFTFVQNDSAVIDGVAVCGSRGWAQPGLPEYKAQDEKICLREQMRLEMSLNSLPEDARLRLVLMHFPPRIKKDQPTPFSDLIKKYGADACIYGHLHGFSGPGLSFEADGVRYYLTSCDYLNFDPVLIWEDGNFSDPSQL